MLSRLESCVSQDSIVTRERLFSDSWGAAEYGVCASQCERDLHMSQVSFSSVTNVPYAMTMGTFQLQHTSIVIPVQLFTEACAWGWVLQLTFVVSGWVEIPYTCGSAQMLTTGNLSFQESPIYSRRNVNSALNTVRCMWRPRHTSEFGESVSSLEKLFPSIHGMV